MVTREMLYTLPIIFIIVVSIFLAFKAKRYNNVPQESFVRNKSKEENNKEIR